MLTRPSLTIQRHINASPEKVWRAWTDPAQIAKWWTPMGNKVVQADMDVRVGGRFHVIMHAPDGGTNDVSGEYREVVPGTKLVFTWAWITTPEHESLVTITLRRDGDATLLTLTHEQFVDEAARDSHHAGWTDVLDTLERLFA
ncbi:SRPBCC family protein [Paraburkholderia sartisoli]|uniref:Uncharacterized conserved protein YndB, AHSA1/START domain n=1 Tax=Paraburkholderia sartisoli TaxID=83784 RepID=A0A1H4ELC1_9BURK|nr:SRPBCC domain-containing protein [Paraburkholderia sartisoli]SEA85873.1 Uncharacterized conserved protein YndB, AHSA1/START domain [Paraburkholderia sartisoli]